MIKLLSLIITITISAFNSNMVKYNNEIFLNDFSINKIFSALLIPFVWL